MRFGAMALPYPWTLCVAGSPHRFSNHAQAAAALRQSVTRGVDNVDCGCMQVNWRYHQARLGTFWSALDPYPNLTVGAALLREHFSRTQDWFQAVGRYHHPSDKVRARRYAREVFERLSGSGVQT